MALQTVSRDVCFRNDSTREILDSVAEFAEVRPVVFDREHALAQLGGLEDLLLDVMTLMTTDSPGIHAGLREALACSDTVALKRAAHTLKGSALIMGAVDLARRLKLVEDLAGAGNLERVADELVEIDRQFNELQRRLAFELNAL